MTMHKALHSTDDLYILSMSRKEGGRRLATIEDTRTQRLYKKELRKTNYSKQKQHWLHKAKQNNNN